MAYIVFDVGETVIIDGKEWKVVGREDANAVNVVITPQHKSADQWCYWIREVGSHGPFTPIADRELLSKCSLQS